MGDQHDECGERGGVGNKELIGTPVSTIWSLAHNNTYRTGVAV